MWQMHTAVNRTTAPGYLSRGPKTDRDLFAQPAAEIALAEVDLTLVDGTVVHARPGPWSTPAPAPDRFCALGPRTGPRRPPTPAHSPTCPAPPRAGERGWASLRA